ncbi:ABC transporter permease [Sphingomonas sp. 10B4]|uniref:ABC transporter permease n=1 Tax=Sphingomonas sp. 10B4 TaxID=3048575 RepID=UPI002AB59E69|nr:ABC transporter permease [Sphingomonas sp. 10B4]MDY7523915.1 ABC transporter permease [Sphingomonas sp. 10B4]MEB0284247.1 ABC transporter permease [Sphingomonas sp. 10B4]
MAKTSSFRLFSDAWEIQRRVIWALLLREMLTRYGRHNIGFLWLFVEPMLFTLGVTTLWTLTKAVHASDLPIVAFALTGYSSVLLWRNMPSRCIAAIKPNLSLMYHRYVKVMDVLLARLLLEGAGATISFVVLSVVFISIGWITPPEDVLQVIGGWILLAWFGMATAILLGSLSEQSEIVDKLWHPASYLLFPLSGAGFLVEILPTEAQKFVLFLPMVHCTEFIREGYFGSKFHAHYDMSYVVTVCAGLTILALAQLRKVSREVIPE